MPDNPRDPSPGLPRPWKQAWADALYAPDGFYRHQAPAAHFSTSAEGVPGGGALLAEAVLALARRHACTRVVDVGCGRGELLTRLRTLAPDLHLTGVDVVDRPADLDVDGWLRSPGGESLPPDLTDLTDALVLAHEWLDVVPCPVAEHTEDGVWRSLRVDASGTEHPGPPLGDEELDWAERWLGPEVQRAEIGLARDRALADLVSRVVSGVVVAVDYGHTADDRPRQGTLTAFRAGRETHPVPDGSCDLTAHVAVDSLLAQVSALAQSSSSVQDSASAQALAPGQVSALGQASPPPVSPLPPARQRESLLDLLPDPDPATPVPHELARREPTAYLRALARRSALAALTARGGLGDFWWLVVVVGARDAA